LKRKTFFSLELFRTPNNLFGKQVQKTGFKFEVVWLDVIGSFAVVEIE